MALKGAKQYMIIINMQNSLIVNLFILSLSLNFIVLIHKLYEFVKSSGCLHFKTKNKGAQVVKKMKVKYINLIALYLVY